MCSIYNTYVQYIHIIYTQIYTHILVYGIYVCSTFICGSNLSESFVGICTTCNVNNANGIWCFDTPSRKMTHTRILYAKLPEIKHIENQKKEKKNKNTKPKNERTKKQKLNAY